jgi:hypothetical protein
VVFEGTAGEALGHRYTLDVFWDGGQTFKVRFAPPFPGQWTYQSQSADASFAAAKGTFTCTAWTDTHKAENPSRRGFVRVCRSGARPGRYFEYADRTPFLWLGDTWWNWTKRGIHLASFEKLADDRAQKGFTLGQLFFAGRGWGSQVLDPGEETRRHSSAGLLLKLEIKNEATRGAYQNGWCLIAGKGPDPYPVGYGKRTASKTPASLSADGPLRCL